MLIQEKNGEKPLVVYYDETTGPGEPLEFAPEESAVLDHINRKVASAGSLEDLADFLFSADQEITPTDRLSFVFLEEEGLRAFSKVVRTRYTPVLLQEGYTRDIRKGSLLQVIEKGHPRVITDLEYYARVHPDSESSVLLAKEGVRSSMTCPLRVNDRMVGFLFRNSRKAEAYDLHHVILHLVTAERISQTVEKAYRIGELEEANRRYTEMLGFVSHELKSPIGSIVLDSNLMIEGYLGDINEKQRKKLKTMVDKAEYLLGMVDDYLNLSRVEQADLAADIRPGVDFIETVLAKAVNIVASQAEEKNITLEIHTPEDPARIACDPDLMRIVMVNLLSNGLKYGVQDGRLEIRTEISEEGLRVRVYNTGPGFPASEKPLLFRKFSRIKTDELLSRKGTGVGLYTAWRIIRLHGGTITAESEEGSWAEFSFFIPRGE